MQKSIFYTLLIAAVTLACGCKDKARPTAKPLPEVEVNEKALAQYQTGVTEKLTGFDRWGKQHGNQVELLNAQGKVIGYLLLAPEKYERIEGYNNYINAAVVISTDKRIQGVAIGQHEETPRFMEQIRKAGFMDRWNDLPPAEAANHKVDAVTRATYSYNAISGEVKAITQEYVQNFEK